MRCIRYRAVIGWRFDPYNMDTRSKYLYRTSHNIEFPIISLEYDFHGKPIPIEGSFFRFQTYEAVKFVISVISDNLLKSCSIHE